MASRQLVVAKQQKQDISNGLKKRIEAANVASSTAEEKIHIAYDYATNVDGYKPKEAALILYKRLVYSPQWIRKYLPAEAINTEKQRFQQAKRLTQNFMGETEDKQTAEHIRKQIGSKSNKVIIHPKKDAQRTAIVIPLERTKKFYIDLQKLKEKAEKQGLRIYSDATVEVLQHNN